MTEETQVPETQVPKRLGSLDAMRGFVMFLLLGGGEIGHAGILSALAAVFDHPVAKTLYQQLQYSQWGTPIHVKDLIRPLFIFVVGAAMPYAFGNRLSRGDSKRQVYWHVVQRAVILYLLGIIAGGHLREFNWERFYLCNNVLQEIAVGYVVASLILLNCSIRGQLVTLAALLLGYWALIMLVPVPGYGAGILTADVNLPRYVDDLVLGGLRPVKWNFTWAAQPAAGFQLHRALGRDRRTNAEIDQRPLGQARMADRRRRGVSGRKPDLEPLVSDDRQRDDRFVGAFRGGRRLRAVGPVLPDHRRVGLSEVGVFLRGDRRQLDRRLHGRPPVRFPPHRQCLRRRPGQVGRAVEQRRADVGGLHRDLADPVLDVPEEDVHPGLTGRGRNRTLTT